MPPSAWERPRRRAILDAALECFSTKGISATSVEDIRKASGASIGSIYHHFGSKEELGGALLAEALREYQVGSSACIENDPDAEEGIKALVRYHLLWIGDHPKLAFFLLMQRGPGVELASTKLIRELNRPFLKKIEAWLARKVEQGTIKDVPRDVFYPLVIGPGQEFARRWLAGRSRTSIEEAAETFAEAAWQALKVDSA